MEHLLSAIILGIVEGLTEFLPVSSTGHLVLASALLGYDAEQWAIFNIVIQLGAIFAVIVLYWRTFWAVAAGLLRNEANSWRFVRNLLVAFLPSAVIGLALHKKIEAMLGQPAIVAVALIVGGIAILAIERMRKSDAIHTVSAIPLGRALGIGFIQCIAMIPGVSRSGATIMGALLLGVERRTAAEFSFFLAIPTMFGATALELVKNRHELTAGGGVGLSTILVGTVVAFLVALVVIKGFTAYISRRGFGPFAWYRIVVGAAALIWLASI